MCDYFTRDCGFLAGSLVPEATITQGQVPVKALRGQRERKFGPKLFEKNQLGRRKDVAQIYRRPEFRPVTRRSEGVQMFACENRC
jgi:hypothetical protein